MNITPKSGPNITPLPTGQPSARDRAIAKLTEAMPAQEPQRHPVENPSQVSPEELSVVKSSDSTQQDNIDSPPVEQPEAKAPKEDPLSTQYALLARKEKALRAKVQAQEAALKAREAAFAEREAAIKAKEAEYQSNYIAKSRIKSDPLSVLAEEGVSYDEITKAILNPQAQQDPRILVELEKLKAEVKEAKDLQAKAKEEFAAQQKQAYTQALNQIRNEAKQLVMTDPSFETIKETGSVKDVVDLIEKTFNEDGILLSVEDAAKEVEDFLVEEAIKLAKISKITKRLQEAAQPKPVQPHTTPSAPIKQPQTMKTLTNSVNASKPISARERAIAAFQGKLK